MRNLIRVPSVVLLAFSTACVHYRPAPMDAPSLGAVAPVPPAGPLAYEAAVRWAVEHDPDLVALRARAAAVNVNPAQEPIEVSGGVDADQRPEAMVSIDALSLLGLGPRKADLALACARRSEAWMRHHERAREVAGEVAEAYAVDSALTGLPDPGVTLDAEAYVRAGLEAGAARGAVAATTAQADAERAARDTARRESRYALLRLLGAAPDAAVTTVPVDAAWPPVPETSPATLLATRGDVQRRVAEYETADAEYRRAVAGQIPGIMLEPGLALDPSSFFGAVRLRLPVGAAREARAAEQSREAARQEVASTLLDAMRDAAIAREGWALAVRKLEAARTRNASDVELFRATKARLETGSGSLLETIFAGRDLVESAMSVREATVEAARARVKAARAAGWPSAEAVR